MSDAPTESAITPTSTATATTSLGAISLGNHRSPGGATAARRGRPAKKSPIPSTHPRALARSALRRRHQPNLVRRSPPRVGSLRDAIPWPMRTVEPPWPRRPRSGSAARSRPGTTPGRAAARSRSLEGTLRRIQGEARSPSRPPCTSRALSVPRPRMRPALPGEAAIARRASRSTVPGNRGLRRAPSADASSSARAGDATISPGFGIRLATAAPADPSPSAAMNVVVDVFDPRTRSPPRLRTTDPAVRTPPGRAPG